MTNIERKKLVLGLLALLILFAIVFFVALANYSRGVPTINIGLPANAEDLLIMLLAIGSIIKVVYEIFIIEERAPGKSRGPPSSA
jgi:hypothetical protein